MVKSHNDVVAVLQDALTAELSTVHQYLLGAEKYRRWGYHRLAEKMTDEVREETEHARKLLERILFIEGNPDVQALYPVAVATGPVEQLQADLKNETDHVHRLRHGIQVARRERDEGSAEVLSFILKQTEEHVDYLEEQLTLVTQLGAPFYLSQQIRGGDTKAGVG